MVSAVSRGRFTAEGENHLDSASGMMLETRERTFRMMELLGSSSGLLSVLVLSTEFEAAVVAIGDRLPWNISGSQSVKLILESL